MSFSLLNFWLLLPTAGLFFFNHGGRAIVRSVGKALPSSCSQGHNALTLGHFAVFPLLITELEEGSPSPDKRS